MVPLVLSVASNWSMPFKSTASFSFKDLSPSHSNISLSLVFFCLSMSSISHPLFLFKDSLSLSLMHISPHFAAGLAQRHKQTQTHMGTRTRSADDLLSQRERLAVPMASLSVCTADTSADTMTQTSRHTDTLPTHQRNCA